MGLLPDFDQVQRLGEQFVGNGSSQRNPVSIASNDYSLVTLLHHGDFGADADTQAEQTPGQLAVTANLRDQCQSADRELIESSRKLHAGIHKINANKNYSYLHLSTGNFSKQQIQTFGQCSAVDSDQPFLGNSGRTAGG